jgi:predicted short-subunit dehydrogenase-like oxidoreductase (DUF2520 family)
MNQLNLKICIIGASNLSWQIAFAFKNAGLEISQVFNRTFLKAKDLANLVDSKPISDYDLLDKNADIYLVSVKDKALAEVLGEMRIEKGIIVHTSGTHGIEVFNNYSFENFGVFYPLQTFSKGSNVEISKVPFLIEANKKEGEDLLVLLARRISENVQMMNSEKRKYLHIAAVFANNFSNYMFNVGEEILSSHNISYDLLKPLIIQTCSKAISNLPKDVQTGPAFREDYKTIETQMELLSENDDLREIYRLITEGIIKQKKYGQL